MCRLNLRKCFVFMRVVQQCMCQMFISTGRAEINLQLSFILQMPILYARKKNIHSIIIEDVHIFFAQFSPFPSFALCALLRSFFTIVRYWYIQVEMTTAHVKNHCDNIETSAYRLIAIWTGVESQWSHKRSSSINHTHILYVSLQ